MIIINNYFKKLKSLLLKIYNILKQLYTSSSNISIDEIMI